MSGGWGIPLLYLCQQNIGRESLSGRLVEGINFKTPLHERVNRCEDGAEGRVCRVVAYTLLSSIIQEAICAEQEFTDKGRAPKSIKPALLSYQ